LNKNARICVKIRTVRSDHERLRYAKLVNGEIKDVADIPLLSSENLNSSNLNHERIA